MNDGRGTLAEEEAEVKAMLSRAGGAAPMSGRERDRARATMMAAAAEGPSESVSVSDVVIDLGATGDPELSSGVPATGEGLGRVLLWAAVVSLVAGTIGLFTVVAGGGDTPAGPIDGSRMRVEVGTVELSFDALNGYTAAGDSDGVVILSQAANARGHFNVRAAHVEPFGGQPARSFLDGLGLRPEEGVADDGVAVWFVFPGVAPDCELRSPCELIATLPNGEPLQLTAGTLTRIEVHDIEGADPLVIVSEVGSTGNGPALLDVSIAD